MDLKEQSMNQSINVSNVSNSEMYQTGTFMAGGHNTTNSVAHSTVAAGSKEAVLRKLLET